MSLAHQPAHLIVLDTGQSIPLNATQMLVGRQDPRVGIYPEVNLQHKTLNRVHAKLRSHNGSYTVEDLNSINKTRLNGVILIPGQEYALHNGDLLVFGSVKVRFEQ